MDDNSDNPHDWDAVLIAGPTASGKSALAIELARRWNGVIVNADSMQLYDGLRIVTARPSAEEEQQVPHRLYGVVPPGEAYSTGAWLDRVAGEIARIRAEGAMPILAGGTGLYFKALTEGFAGVPEIDPAIRAKARDLADRNGVDGLKAALAGLDPGAASGLPDPQRLTRALEVVWSTGKPLSHWQQTEQEAGPLDPARCLRLVLAPPRPWLHQRIAERADAMLCADGIEEVRGLLERGLSASLPAMRAIGVREIGDFIHGRLSRTQAVERLTVATRQYAKRQETWFRNQMADWQRLDPSQESCDDLMKQLNDLS